MGIREAVGKSVISSDLSDGFIETDIDRVGSLGKAGKLGRLLWHWKYADDNSAILPAFHLLVRRAAKRLRIRCVGPEVVEYDLLRLACKQALVEWINPNCDVCQGAREVMTNTLITCPSCHGGGLRQFSDIERATALHMDIAYYLKHWEKRMADIAIIIYGADAETAAIVNTQLKDDDAKIVDSEKIAA